MTDRISARMLGTIAALLMVAACGGASAVSPATVTIAGFTYAPSPISVPAGTTVTWSNEDDIVHTVTSGTPDAPGTHPLDGTLDGPGTSYEATLSDPGTFAYFCARHNGMRGSVTVT